MVFKGDLKKATVSYTDRARVGRRAGELSLRLNSRADSHRPLISSYPSPATKFSIDRSPGLRLAPTRSPLRPGSRRRTTDWDLDSLPLRKWSDVSRAAVATLMPRTKQTENRPRSVSITIVILRYKNKHKTKRKNVTLKRKKKKLKYKNKVDCFTAVMWLSSISVGGKD